MYGEMRFRLVSTTSSNKGESIFMSGITLKDVLEKLEEAIEAEDWNIVQELLNTIEMELEYENPFDQYHEEEMD